MIDMDVLSSNGQWRHRIAWATQMFAGRLLETDPAYFLRAVRFLARELPASVALHERETLRKELVECALRASLRFHTEYHRLMGSECCTAAPLDTIAALWAILRVTLASPCAGGCTYFLRTSSDRIGGPQPSGPR